MLDVIKHANEKIKGIILSLDKLQNELNNLHSSDMNENELAQIISRKISAAGVELITANDIIYEAEDCIDERDLQNLINEYSGDAV